MAITSRPVEDKDKLRRFYLNWGLKEAYVKAIGQGLGYDLQRVSFVNGTWLDCCRWANDGNDNNNEPSGLPSHNPSSEPVPHPSCGYHGLKVGSLNTPENSELWGREDNVGCTSGLGTATVKVRKFQEPYVDFGKVKCDPLERYLALVTNSHSALRLVFHSALHRCITVTCLTDRRDAASRLVVPCFRPT